MSIDSYYHCPMTLSTRKIDSSLIKDVCRKGEAALQ